jgi:hypothetical protein
MNVATEPGPGEKSIEVSTTATVTSPAEPSTVTKVIVAVHGIGDQYSFATIQSVVNQFCVYYQQPAGVPLGRFHGGTAAYSIPEPYPREPFERLAFAEVYWAPIARNVENEKHTLEEAKKWARTIVERLRLRWHGEGRKGGCRDEDFRLTQQVLGEMIQTIAVVDRLCFLADKAGLFTFDLKNLLDNYLGDVQIVAEFTQQREEILTAFAKLLESVGKAFPNAEIHLVTHSEGTVVAFLGLLDAFRSKEPPPWAEKVRGFMTFGSPLDKHLALWPELFGECPPTRDPAQKIEWRNYYDFGDPVGFALDDIREWIGENRWGGVFNFDDSHDMGFTRYPFPGKAHVDYWMDEEVFGHFISTVAMPEAPGKPAEGPRPKPADKWEMKWLSYILPYVGVAALLFLAAYVLYKAVTTATGFTGFPDAHGVFPKKLGYGLIAQQVAGLTALLLGITAVARIPRLTRLPSLRALSFAIAGFGAFAYMWSVRSGDATQVLGLSVPPGGITLAAAGMVVLLVYAVSVLRPCWGLTPLIGLGAAGAVGMVASHMQGAPGPFWPVVLATVAFLYLWWLAALVFDLVFVWHWYIRQSKLMTRVHEVLGKYKDRVTLPSPPVPVAAMAGSK